MTFRENIGERGGGLSIRGGTVNFSGTVENNAALLGGGFLVDNGAYVIIASSRIIDNGRTPAAAST